MLEYHVLTANVEPFCYFFQKFKADIVSGEPKFYLSYFGRDDDENSPSKIKILLGQGDFRFRVEEQIIVDVSVIEDGPPLATDQRIEMPQRLIIRAECQEHIDKLLNRFEQHKKIIFKKDKLKTNILICDKYGDWRTYSRIPKRNISTIYIDNEIKNKLIDDIRDFKANEAEYDRFGIPYKKTYLLTGIPGSGKTSLIKAICNELDCNLGMLSVSKEFDNNSLMSAIRFLEKNTILLLEDIDALFEKRSGTHDNPGITFSNLINIMDGVLYKHGTIIFITTNHPEKLDPALLRVGRIDMIVQINYPGKKEIRQLFIDMMNNKATEEEIEAAFERFWKTIANKKITMSAIVNFLFRYRMKFQDNMKELLETNYFVQSVTGEDKHDLLYS